MRTKQHIKIIHTKSARLPRNEPSSNALQYRDLSISADDDVPSKVHEEQVKDKVDTKVSEEEKVGKYAPVFSPMHNRVEVEEQMQRRYQIYLLHGKLLNRTLIRTQASVTATVKVAYIRVTIGTSRYLSVRRFEVR